MSEEIKDIFECLKKYANLTPDAIDDLYYLEGTIEDLQQKVEQLENIRKEIRELAEERKERTKELSWVEMKVDNYIEEQDELLEILDKEVN